LATPDILIPEKSKKTGEKRTEHLVKGIAHDLAGHSFPLLGRRYPKQHRTVNLSGRGLTPKHIQEHKVREVERGVRMRKGINSRTLTVDDQQTKEEEVSWVGRKKDEI
jgi:hypothetical protein